MKTNKHPGLTMTFGLADLPMLAGALSIGRNTAMMYHKPRQQARMEEYRKAFDEAIPYAARAFGRYDFYDIVTAVSEGARYEVHAQGRDRWSHDKHVLVVMPDRTYSSKDAYREGVEAVVAAVKELLDEISPTAEDAA